MITGKHGRALSVLALGLILAVLGTAFFAGTISSLIEEWSKPEYSHCLLLILVALGWSVYLYREKKPVLLPSARGLTIVLFAVLMNIFGNVAANNWINQYSIVIMIAGIVVTLAGIPAFRALFPALFLLSFTIPLPPLMMAGLTAEMQLLSSTLSVAGLNLLHIPVYQEGNIIDLGDYKLQVAEACSGLRYLFPLVSFGYLFALLFETSWWKRGTLILATVPLTIFMNALRIILVGVTVNLWGMAMAEGVLHEFEGWVVFAGCIALLLLLHWGLSFIATPIRATPQPSLVKPSPPLYGTAKVHTLLIVLIVCMIAGVASQHLITFMQKEAPPERKSFADFPLHIGAWQGRTENLPPDQIETLKLSDYLLADYQTDEKNSPVNFFVAYYASQRQNAAPHSPLVCINGAGWEIASMTSDYTVLDADGAPLLHVNRAIIKNGEATELVYFWFEERGRDLTSTSARKWYLFKDSLMKGRTDGALVRVATPIDKSDDETEADHRLSSFLDDITPLMKDYVPD